MKTLEVSALVSTLSLMALLACSPVQAAEKNAEKTPTKTTQTTKPKAQEQKKAKPTSPKDSNLAQFNKSVGVQFTARGIQKGPDGQPYLTLTYLVQNKSKTGIKSLLWVSAYTLNKKTFYIHELPAEFAKPLPAGKQVDITLSVPLSELPEEAQKHFLNKTANIRAINGAKSVVFANGKKIVVAQ